VASRLYRTTRPLDLQVICALDQLGIATVGTPTTLALVALYVTGLVLLDARPTQTRVTRTLPGRRHDALNRLLRATPWSTRSLMAGLIGWVTRSGMTGYLCLDDVVVEKAFAKRLPWAGWTYSFANKRKVSGMHVVVVLCAASTGASGSRSRCACGGPNDPARRPPTRPNWSWPRGCSPSWPPPGCRSSTW
jgi:hypothetical protein